MPEYKCRKCGNEFKKFDPMIVFPVCDDCKRKAEADKEQQKQTEIQSKALKAQEELMKSQQRAIEQQEQDRAQREAENRRFEEKRRRDEEEKLRREREEEERKKIEEKKQKEIKIAQKKEEELLKRFNNKVNEMIKEYTDFICVGFMKPEFNTESDALNKLIADSTSEGRYIDCDLFLKKPIELDNLDIIDWKKNNVSKYLLKIEIKNKINYFFADSSKQHEIFKLNSYIFIEKENVAHFEKILINISEQIEKREIEEERKLLEEDRERKKIEEERQKKLAEEREKEKEKKEKEERIELFYKKAKELEDKVGSIPYSSILDWFIEIFDTFENYPPSELNLVRGVILEKPNEYKRIVKFFKKNEDLIDEVSKIDNKFNLFFIKTVNIESRHSVLRTKKNIDAIKSMWSSVSENDPNFYFEYIDFLMKFPKLFSGTLETLESNWTQFITETKNENLENNVEKKSGESKEKENGLLFHIKAKELEVKVASIPFSLQADWFFEIFNIFNYTTVAELKVFKDSVFEKPEKYKRITKFLKKNNDLINEVIEIDEKFNLLFIETVNLEKKFKYTMRNKKAFEAIKSMLKSLGKDHMILNSEYHSFLKKFPKLFSNTLKIVKSNYN